MTGVNPTIIKIQEIIFYRRAGPLCDVPHRLGEQVPGAIYVETPLNQVDAF